jgi:two-component system, OmpR family, sensor histidine kinase KdpD
MPADPVRPNPDQLLLAAEAEARAARRGYLKIFLGYTSGAGKSHRMLDEARRRAERGQDVVIGGIQPRVPPEIGGLLANLEVIPLRDHALDLSALLIRRPSVCFIDGLAYANPPGTRNPTRWQDVESLLNAGIKVVASINIQYVAELQPQVEAITGKHAADSVPMAFIQSSDEIEIVDAPPEEPGDRQIRLARLREIALTLAADVVDHQLVDYLDRHGIEQRPGAHERLMVCLTPRANAAAMFATASDIAARFHAELIAAYVSQPEIAPADQALLDEKLAIARAAGATIEILEGESPVDAILNFAHTRAITQLFIGHSQRTGLAARLFGNPVEKLIRRAAGMDIRIFPQ